jgi:hypothetical protein
MTRAETRRRGENGAFQTPSSIHPLMSPTHGCPISWLPVALSASAPLRETSTAWTCLSRGTRCGAPADDSPQRELWVGSRNGDKPRRGDRSRDPTDVWILKLPPTRNGEATSSSPFQSLSQRDEDIATPKPFPMGPVSRSTSYRRPYCMRGVTRAETRRRRECGPLHLRHRVTRGDPVHGYPNSWFPAALSASAPLRETSTAWT